MRRNSKTLPKAQRTRGLSSTSFGHITSLASKEHFDEQKEKSCRWLPGNLPRRVDGREGLTSQELFSIISVPRWEEASKFGQIAQYCDLKLSLGRSIKIIQNSHKKGNLADVSTVGVKIGLPMNPG